MTEARQNQLTEERLKVESVSGLLRKVTQGHGSLKVTAQTTLCFVDLLVGGGARMGFDLWMQENKQGCKQNNAR